MIVENNYTKHTALLSIKCNLLFRDVKRDVLLMKHHGYLKYEVQLFWDGQSVYHFQVHLKCINIM